MEPSVQVSPAHPALMTFPPSSVFCGFAAAACVACMRRRREGPGVAGAAAGVAVAVCVGTPCCGRRAMPPHRAYNVGNPFRGGRGVDTPCRPSVVLGPRAVSSWTLRCSVARSKTTLQNNDSGSLKLLMINLAGRGDAKKSRRSRPRCLTQQSRKVRQHRVSCRVCVRFLHVCVCLYEGCMRFVRVL